MHRLRLPVALAFMAVMLLSAQPGFAQSTLPPSPCLNPNPLCLSNNYFVTGDYVVGSVGLRGLGDTTGFAAGAIHIPDPNSVPATGVPAGAEVVAAILYWETVEKDKSTFAGLNGFFNGYAITGSPAGNNAPTSWSSGGCSGNPNGTTVIRAYRADVRPFLPLDANGQIQTPNLATPGSYQVRLADSGSNGGGTPLTLGASLIIIWRVLSPPVPLRSIVLYDGAAAPFNGASTMSQPMIGFYQAAASADAKLTQVVGNGQNNKSETVTLTDNVNTVTLPSLYGNGTLPPFPGFYNQNNTSPTGGGSWDSPTWFGGNSPINNAVMANDASVTTSVGPNGPGSACVDWGMIVFSVVVPNTTNDALLPAWKAANPPGYTDAQSNQFVALPGASTTAQDIFVEIDYLSNLDGLAGPYLHSHLPKQLALDRVGDAFANHNIHLHFDVGTNFTGLCKLTLPVGNQQSCPDPYIIQNGTGGNAISESAVVCADSGTPPLCQFPGTPAVRWKQGLLFVKNNVTVPNSKPPVPLGNFQFGRKDSYHYVLFGHALGTPRFSWTAFAATLTQNTSLTKLTSIVNTGNSAIVTILSPPGVVKPGDCPNAAIPACSSDANAHRVTVGGAIVQPALNRTYKFTNPSSSTVNNVTTTTFTIATVGVPDGTYTFRNEPRLVVTYLGPTSSSGHSDLGGGDSEVTFGLWPADDAPGCQADPSVPLNSGQVYCVDQVGTIQAEEGTLLHELGHSLALSHGGTFYTDPLHPSVPSYGLNCSSSFLSSMNYLFQTRGFPDPFLNLLADGSFPTDHPIDYSSQIFSPLDETKLNESTGIGPDSGGNLALHFTRWYAPPNALQRQVGQFATLHCDGTPILDGAQMVRVDGTTFSFPIDWNNDGNTTDTGLAQDINFNDNFFNTPSGSNVDSPFVGFNDWTNVNLLQVSSRLNALGFSAGTGVGGESDAIGGGESDAIGGGESDAIGGGESDAIGGGESDAIGGGEQNVEGACSTADSSTGLMAKPGTKSVVLNWTAPGGPCQVFQYDIWRATSPSPTFTLIATLGRIKNGNKTTAPPPTFTDTTVKNNNTYTYFVTDHNVQGAGSSASNMVSIFVSP